MLLYDVRRRQDVNNASLMRRLVDSRQSLSAARRLSDGCGSEHYSAVSLTRFVYPFSILTIRFQFWLLGAGLASWQSAQTLLFVHFAPLVGVPVRSICGSSRLASWWAVPLKGHGNGSSFVVSDGDPLDIGMMESMGCRPGQSDSKSLGRGAEYHSLAWRLGLLEPMVATITVL